MRKGTGPLLSLLSTLGGSEEIYGISHVAGCAMTSQTQILKTTISYFL